MFVGDLVKGAWEILKGCKVGAFNIGTGTSVSINELAKLCAQFSEVTQVNHGPERAGDIKYSLSSPDKIY